MPHYTGTFGHMNYILYVSQRNKIVGLIKSSTIMIRPASLGQ